MRFEKKKKKKKGEKCKHNLEWNVSDSISRTDAGYDMLISDYESDLRYIFISSSPRSSFASVRSVAVDSRRTCWQYHKRSISLSIRYTPIN